MKRASERDGAKPYGYEELAVTGAAKRFVNIPTSGPLVGGLIEVETASIRIRVDGVAPTAEIGHLRTPGQTEYLNAEELIGLLAIPVTVDGLLRVTYYKG